MPCLDHNKKGNAKGYSTVDFEGTNTTLHRKVYCVANNVLHVIHGRTHCPSA